MSTEADILSYAKHLGFAVSQNSGAYLFRNDKRGLKLHALFDNAGRMQAASINGKLVEGPRKSNKVRAWLRAVQNSA